MLKSMGMSHSSFSNLLTHLLPLMGEMMSQHKEVIARQHLTYLAYLNGLQVAFVIDSGVDLWEDQKVLWIPSEISDLDYLSGLFLLGEYLSKGHSPEDKIVAAWGWALDRCKLPKRSYMLAMIEDSLRLSGSTSKTLDNLMTVVTNRV